MKVIFLDIDGVLNNDSYSEYYAGLRRSEANTTAIYDPDSIVSLNNITRATGAVIVVSSAWRAMGMDKLTPILREWGVEAEIIGETDQLDNAPRGWEIEKWMGDWDWSKGTKRGTQIESYLILDDYSDMMYDQRYNFIKTDSDIGLQTVHESHAIDILNNEQL